MIHNSQWNDIGLDWLIYACVKPPSSQMITCAMEYTENGYACVHSNRSCTQEALESTWGGIISLQIRKLNSLCEFSWPNNDRYVCSAADQRNISQINAYGWRTGEFSSVSIPRNYRPVATYCWSNHTSKGHLGWRFIKSQLPPLDITCLE